MKNSWLLKLSVFAAGLLVGWACHIVMTADRLSVTDSVAASWTTLAVALLEKDGLKSGDAVKDSTLAALVAYTPTLGMNYRQIENSQLRGNVIGLARKLYAQPDLFASLQLPGDGEKARLVLMCISTYAGAFDDGRVETCSTLASTRKGVEHKK